MLRGLAQTALSALFTCGLFFFSSHILMASETANGPKDKAISEALNLAENNTVVSRENAVVPEYRQKLKEAVTTEEGEEEFPLEWDSYYRYTPSTKLKDQPGKISVAHSESELSYNMKAFGKLPLQFSVNGEYININKMKNVPVTLPGHLTAAEFGLQATLPFFGIKNTYFRAKVQPGFYSDDWNFTSNTFRLNSYTYLIYQPSDKWTFIAGVAAFPGEETAVLPIGGFIFKPNDRLAFNIIPSTPTISYEINKMITVFLEGGFSGTEYKVKKDNFHGAALSYNETHAGLGLEFTLNKYIDAYISSGYMFNHYLKYRDSLGKVDLNNNYYTEFRLEARI